MYLVLEAEFSTKWDPENLHSPTPSCYKSIKSSKDNNVGKQGLLIWWRKLACLTHDVESVLDSLTSSNGRLKGKWISTVWSGERQPRRWNRKTLISSPPMGTPKLQLLAEQPSMRMTWRLAEKIFPQLDTENGITMRQVGGTETQYSQDTPPGLLLHKQEEHDKCRSPPRGMRGPSPTSDSTPWESCIGKTSSQNVWIWKPSGLMFGRAREL